jgi:peptidoglycan/xylan/chitin deacetylase (PgdA/CDA1 family)
MQNVYGAAKQVLRYLLVELVGRSLYYSGALYLIGYLRQRIGRPRLLIPMYHRVSGGPDPPASLLSIQQGVPVHLFQQHLRVLRWFGPLLTLDDAFSRLRGACGPVRTFVALTFDDGYRDNVTVALPALRANGAKATFFPVVRTASGGRPLWWDELTTILSEGHWGGASHDSVLASVRKMGQGPPNGELGPDIRKDEVAALLCDWYLELPNEHREASLDALASRLKVPRRRRDAHQLYATWHELQSTIETCEIGGHTCDHLVLTCEDSSLARSQISDCRTMLESELGKSVSSFAYPNGRHNAAIRSLTAEAGYRLAVTVQAGVNYRETDPYALRRVPIHRERPFHLALKLAFNGWVHRD